MSQDVCVFHSSEIDTKQLPEGHYVAVMSGERCEEATGPYPTEVAAIAAMTTKGGAVWLYGSRDHHTYRWDGKRFVPRPRFAP